MNFVMNPTTGTRNNNINLWTGALHTQTEEQYDHGSAEKGTTDDEE